MSLDPSWAAGLLQVLCGLFALLIGVPGFLLQNARPELRPLVEKKIRLVPFVAIAVSGFNLIAVIIVFSRFLGMADWHVFAISTFAIFASSATCGTSLWLIQHRTILSLAISQCHPRRCQAGFAWETMFSEGIEDLKLLAHGASPGLETLRFMEEVSKLSIDWQVYVGDYWIGHPLRYEKMAELARLVVLATSSDGKLSEKEELTWAISMLDEYFELFTTFGEIEHAQTVQEDLRRLTLSIIERAAIGRELALKDLVDLCMERFRNSEPDLYRFGRDSVGLPSSWGLEPAIIKLRARILKVRIGTLGQDDVEPGYLIGLAAIFYSKGEAERAWVEKNVFRYLEVDDTDLEFAHKFHFELGNFEASNALIAISNREAVVGI